MYTLLSSAESIHVFKMNFGYYKHAHIVFPEDNVNMIIGDFS